jgi:hypothetical protein
MREGQTIDEICLKLHATDFHLYQRLYALFRQGCITPFDPKSGTPPAPDLASEPVGEELPAEEILKHAKEFITGQKWTDAEKLAARAQELKPSPEALAVLREAEAGLTAQLKKELIEKPRVPCLAVAQAKLKEMALTPQERYLLSRIDGSRDVRAIIRVSPIREIDALKSFTRFVEQGLIALK